MAPLHYRIIFIEVGLLLLAAMAELPYLFYKPIRITVVVGAVFLMVRAAKVKQVGWYIPAATSFVMFAPGFGFEFPKSTWVVIDLAFGITFLVAGLALGKPFKIQAKVPDLDSDFDDAPFDRLENENNEANPLIGILVTSLVIGVIFAMFGNPYPYSGCDNWVADQRGGYCDG